MSNFLNFSEFRLFESNAPFVKDALFKSRVEQEDLCVSFIGSNTPFIKKAYIPSEGHGATANDFINGVCLLKATMNKSSYFQFSPYIKSKGIFDLGYRKQRTEYLLSYGKEIHIGVLNGTSDMKLTGTIYLIAGGKNWILGNYSDPGGYKSTVSKVYEAILDSDNSDDFATKMDKIVDTIGDRTIMKHNSEFMKIALGK